MQKSPNAEIYSILSAYMNTPPHYDTTHYDIAAAVHIPSPLESTLASDSAPRRARAAQPKKPTSMRRHRRRNVSSEKRSDHGG